MIKIKQQKDSKKTLLSIYWANVGIFAPISQTKNKPSTFENIDEGSKTRNMNINVENSTSTNAFMPP